MIETHARDASAATYALRAYYAADIDQFLRHDPLAILGAMTAAGHFVLQLQYSPDGQPPYTVQPAVVDAQRNRISTAIDAGELGFYFIGQGPVTPEICFDGFELR